MHINTSIDGATTFNTGEFSGIVNLGAGDTDHLFKIGLIILTQLIHSRCRISQAAVMTTHVFAVR